MTFSSLTKKKRIRALALASLCWVTLHGSVAQAEDQTFGRPRFEVRAATSSSKGSDALQVLARISFSGVDGRVLRLPAVFFRVSGEIAISDRGISLGERVPYLDFEVIPMIYGTNDIEGEHVATRLGAIHVSRSLPLDEQLSVRVDLFGLQSQTQSPFKIEYDPTTIAFLNVTADLLGYRSVERLRPQDTFRGFDLAGSETEGGVIFKTGDYFRTTVSVGAMTGTALGTNGNGEFGNYFGAKFYLQLREDFQNLAETVRVSLYGRLEENLSKSPGVEMREDLRLLGGALVAF